MNKNTLTTPIENYAWNEPRSPDTEFFREEMMDIMRLSHIHNVRPVQYFKSVLGKQSYVFLGSERMWVWERDNWRVYVGNNKGICLEVPLGLAPGEWKTSFHSFRQHLGRV